MSTNSPNSHAQFPLNFPLDQLTSESWVVWDNLFSQKELELILNQSEQAWKSGTFNPAKIGRSDQRKTNQDIRSDSTMWLDKSQTQWAAPLEKIDQLKSYFNQNLYLGLDQFEGHLARYDSGQKYDRHIDQSLLSSPLHGKRVITLVLYLNRNWKASDGGELCLFLKSKEQLIEPIWGRAVFFLSDTIPHAVLESKNIRWSLTGWFRRH